MSTPDQPTPPSGQPDPYGTPRQPDPYGTPQQPPQAPQYGAPQAPQYGTGYGQGYGAPVAENPGKTLGIVGLIVSFLGCFAVVGLILSIVALRKSKKAGFSNTPAVVGIVVGVLVTIASIVGAILIGVSLAHIAEVCNDLGPGTHYRDGVTYNCP